MDKKRQYYCVDGKIKFFLDGHRLAAKIQDFSGRVLCMAAKMQDLEDRVHCLAAKVQDLL